MPTEKTNELSDRELEILKLVATGASNKEIAQNSFITQNTVKVHLRNIFWKIGVTSRTEAAMYAVRIGLVETVSSQELSQDESNQRLDNPELQSEKSNASTLLKSKGANNRIVQYIGLLGGLILLFAVLLFIYDLTNNNQVNSTVQPTSTPRVQWFQLPGLPTLRSGLAVTSYENQIYAIGGENPEGICNITQKYDPQANQWTNLALKPTPVTDSNAAVIGGLIYVPGGKLATGLPTDIMEIYDPRTDRWSVGSPLPKPLSGYALVAYEGRLFLFGGWDGSQVVKVGYVFDSRNNSWSEIQTMPTARSYAGAVVVGEKIYIIGGWDGNQALSVNEVFLPDYAGVDSSWVQAPSLPSGRYGMGITNLADIIFIIGGIGSEDNLTSIALSSSDSNWGQLQSPLQSDWAFLGAATVGTRLYALGGETQTGLYDQMWSYQAIFTITFPIIR